MGSGFERSKEKVEGGLLAAPPRNTSLEVTSLTVRAGQFRSVTTSLCSKLFMVSTLLRGTVPAP